MSTIGRELLDAANLTISRLLETVDERDKAHELIHEIVKAAGPIEVPHDDSRASIPGLYSVITYTPTGTQYVCPPSTDLSHYFNQLTEEP